ncbi:MAG: carboxypeptidase M32 [Bdellovibrionales bacterium]|nr:carboxypeptidase M32 [Bdellovibrionales bacterium]
MEKIKSYLQEYSYLRSIQSLLQWDMETMMPPGAIDDRAKRLSYIQGKIHGHITSPDYQKLLKEFAAKKKLSAKDKMLLQELKWDYELNHALPAKHVEELTLATAHATHAWGIAKGKNDLKSFLPHLQKLIDLKRREAGYFKTKKPYDALIRLHDKEFTSTQISKIFSDLKKGLLKLTSDVNRDGKFTKISDLKGPFPIEDQRALSLQVAKLFGLQEAHSRLDISNHPFSINISPQDQRITTRYDLNHLDSLSSTMHEVGHALYEFNLPREWEGTPFQEAVSLSVHESQSRFWENIVGRSRPFSAFILPHMKKTFPKSMKGIDADKLFHIFNKSVPGIIRVESSELYYNLHIIIRYEIEEMIFNQGLNAKDIPKIWKEKYKEYLGITPKNDAEGVLQDSHWAGGAFGYFPTYTLGNLISGSLYMKLKKAVPNYEKQIQKGEFSDILNFLVTNIHSKGRSVTAQDLVGELSVKDYLKYLEEKFKG